MKPRSLALSLFGYAVLVFIMAPILIVVVASFSPARYMQFPPPSLSLRWYRDVLGSSEWLGAFGASVVHVVVLENELALAPLIAAVMVPVVVGA